MILPGTDAAKLESVIAARWDALRAWLAAAPRDPSVVAEIKTHLDAWDAFEAQDMWSKEEGALSSFAAELNGAELTASKPTPSKPDPKAPDYVPPGPPVKGVDIEVLVDLPKEVIDAGKAALPPIPPLPAIPWTWKLGGAVAIVTVLAAGAKVAYESSGIGTARRMLRERKEEAQRRAGRQ